MPDRKKNIAIYGAGVTGKKVFKNLKRQNKYNITTFVDDSFKLHGTELFKLPIITFDNLIKLIKKKKKKKIYITIPSFKNDEKKNLIKKI